MVDLPSNLSSQRRLEWMDFVRGFAILLVILLHAIDITIKYTGELPEWLLVVSRTFDPLRMPLMTFLSGILLARSLAKGPRPFLEGKVRNILYPYFLWSFIYVSMWIAASSVVHGDHGLHEYLYIFYDPPGHLWFIYNIFLYYCFMLVAKSVSPLLLMAATWLVAGALSQYDLSDWNRLFFLFGFFVLGHYATLHAATVGQLLRDPRVIVFMVIGVLAMPTAALISEETLRYEPVSLPMAFAGIGLTLILGRAIGAAPGLAPFRYVGVRSLQAFILHWLVIATTVIGLTRVIGLEQPMPVFLIAFATAIVATFVALWVIDHLRLRFLFAWPQWPTARARKLDGYDTAQPPRSAD